jgi:iron complex outermembrane receptor protein
VRLPPAISITVYFPNPSIVRNPMNPSIVTCTALAIAGTMASNLSASDAAARLQPLIVRGERIDDAWSLTEMTAGSEITRLTDAAARVRNLPGVAIVRNGSQTGIVQLRGLSGDRVAVRVDGMAITPACPNHMDPPLHYANPAGDDLIQLYSGISPVSVGGDHIGGSLTVSQRAPEFADESGLLGKGELSAAFLGSQNAWRSGADLTVAGADVSFRYRGTIATADELRFPGGTVRASGFDTTSHNLTGSWRTNGGYFSLDAGLGFTRDSGTPSLPMDMIEDDSWHFGLTQQEKMNWGTLKSRLYVHDVDHLMDNHSLRPILPGSPAMDSPANSRDYGWRGDLTVPRGSETVRLGIDLHRSELDAQQVAVATGMRRDTFNDSSRSRFGAYADWEHEFNREWSSRAGLRTDWVASDSGAVSNAILPPPGPQRNAILADQNRFNQADRTFTDGMVDATVALRFKPDEATTVELAAAVKNRAPSLVERYLWTPLNASAGLADGRTYLGNLDLDPETAFELALGMTHKGADWNLGLTPFYQYVSGYIQGLPIARIDGAGNPVLQYQNLDDAELYGCEMVAGYDFTPELSIDSTLSYVRGRSDDTGGDLYRIAPLRGLIDLSYRRDWWEAHLECSWAEKQSHVAAIQGEQTSPGFAIWNLRLARTFAQRLRVEVGVENLLDKSYAEHLGGVNRVGSSDVAIGQHIPGAGRFGYVSLGWEF